MVQICLRFPCTETYAHKSRFCIVNVMTASFLPLCYCSQSFWVIMYKDDHALNLYLDQLYSTLSAIGHGSIQILSYYASQRQIALTELFHILYSQYLQEKFLAFLAVQQTSEMLQSVYKHTLSSGLNRSGIPSLYNHSHKKSCHTNVFG